MIIQEDVFALVNLQEMFELKSIGLFTGNFCFLQDPSQALKAAWKELTQIKKDKSDELPYQMVFMDLRMH